MKETPRTAWGIVALAVGAGIVAAAHVGKLPPALPEIRAELNLSLVGGGWAVSIFSVTGMLAGLFAGTVADRLGPWRVTLGGLGALLIGSLAGSLAGSEAALLLSRFLEGLGFIAVAVTAPSVIVRAARPCDRRLALGTWGTYMPAGTAAMMVAAPALLAAADWRGLWQTSAALTLLWLGLMAATRTHAPADHDGGPRSSVGGNLRLTLLSPGPWLLAACFGLYTIPWLAIMVWLPSFMIETRGISTATAAALTALVVACNVPGNLAAGALLHRGARHWQVIAAAATAMGLACMGIFSDSLPDLARYGLCLAFSGLGGMLPTAVLAGAPVFAPTPGQIGTTNGLLVQGSNTGQVIGPTAVAAAVQASGAWEAGAGVAVGACALGTAIALFLRFVFSFLKSGGQKTTHCFLGLLQASKWTNNDLAVRNSSA